MTTTTMQARIAVFEADADDDVVRVTRKAVQDGTHEWIWDMQVNGVVGLVETGTNKGLVIVYADDDWECSDRMDDLLYADERSK